MRFSERNGYKPIRSIIQKESMDERLRVSLWNVLHECLWDRAFSNQESFCTLDSHLGKLIKSYWSTFFQLPLDLIPEEFEEALQQIRKYFFNFDLLFFTPSIDVDNLLFIFLSGNDAII